MCHLVYFYYLWAFLCLPKIFGPWGMIGVVYLKN